MKIVSGNLRELTEKTPDPDAQWMQPAIRNVVQTLVDWDRQVHACGVLVRQTEATLRSLRAAREEEA
jgi:phage shock protein A